MKKIIVLLVIIAAFSNNSFSQTRYIIRLKDKGTSPYSFSNPAAFLTNRALQRRTRYNIAIDSADIPVTPRYVDSIRLAGAVTILNTSKWLNQVAIQTTDAAALTKINSFPFVISTSAIAARAQGTVLPINKKFDAPYTSSLPGKPNTKNATSDYYSYGLSFGQVHIHNGEFLHNRGFRGEGMQMAVLDAGFYHYLTLPTFDSIRNNSQILGTWDFVTGNASVDEDHPHGMNCLSTIAANMPGTFVGTAPKTSFYLYRTEDAPTEYPIEEQNWAAGAERADSLGVDVCSVSLGYTTFDNAIYNHTYADMNGNTTIISNAADIAAKKGMLIVVAAGNEGSGSWHYISAPADADSVLAIGAVNTSGVIGGFSSYGPSSDGQIKPGVAAVGVGAVVANTTNGQPSFGNGTSFACPNMAGLSTCLWQAFPEVNNMTIISTLQQSATKATNPDDRVGYGIPDMKKAFALLIKQLFTKQVVAVTGCKSSLQFTAKTATDIGIVIERKLLTDADYVAINTQNSSGAFTARNFTYTDDLTTVASTTIKYRLKMNIGVDTSFYLDSMQINFAPKPNFGTDKTVAKCSDSSVNLNSLYTTTGLTALWTLNGTAVANPAAINTGGTYQLIANTVSGCADTALATVNFIAKPNIGADKSFSKCTDSSFNLTPLYNTTGLTAAWTINNTSVTNLAAVVLPGTYKLVVANANGCSDTALVTLTNDPLICPVIIPVVITDKITISPNPVSDYIEVMVSKTVAAKIEIAVHNEAGQKIYGIINQQPAGKQVYTIPAKQLAGGIYYITVKTNGAKEIVKKIMKR
jgi:serine protease AprX